MIVQNCHPLLVIISKIESLISEQKARHPELTDEEILTLLTKKFSEENRL